MLRAALNAAIAQQLITFNPAAHADLEAARRPKAWRWTDTHLDAGPITVAKQLVVNGWEV
ncbi:hypothetical protein ACFVX6_17485 [Streptomyces sp. NPDC058289]|uniref:hypothetical protein n=1 Tax=Streptomyces sp. NPDC058289 TaxID=3346425 RepID=UPI0036EEA895